jgi:asparagine synthase (glutamine-hydrolysing)
MCGIAGIVLLNGVGTVRQEQLHAMANTMVHRGPDDEGFFFDGSVGLAHRRLSIIDLSQGHQPMFNEDDRLVIVFNGEIYNHTQLRSRLEAAGHRYRTHSDTESILHAYEEFGDEFESELTGMFALAIWDRVRKRLVLSRDRLGIKPLYYVVVGNQLMFASEIKALLAVAGVERQVDYDALDAYLSLRYVPGEKTLFRGIFKLLPGHTLTVEQGGVRTVRQYWDLSFHPEPGDESQLKAELEQLLFDVCRDHLMSEVPYGVFLSGGIDSSAVVAVLSQILQDPVRTFTVGYEQAAEVNEFDYAGLVSRSSGTEHHELRLSAQDFAEWIPQLVWHLDEPVGDAACIPLYFLARYAKPRATVLESGEGADEIFGGYSIYLKMLTMARMRALIPAPVVNLLSRVGDHVGGGGKFSRYCRLFGKPLSEAYRGVSGHFLDGMRQSLLRPEWSASLGGHTYLSHTLSSYFARVRDCDPLNQMLYFDSKTWLPDDLLIKADRMTMAASVELRVPFLDHRLVEFAARLSPAHKIKGKTTKYLLKEVVEPYLPREVVHRPKKGFPVPVAAWFRGGLYDLACEVMLGPSSRIVNFIRREELSQLLHRHKAGQEDFSNELWGLLVLEYWFQGFGVHV